MTSQIIPKLERCQNYLTMFLAGVIFLAFLIPLWYAFFNTYPFVYTNAWDDANYLSWQGALGTRNNPGYFGTWLILGLQVLGLSGAVQNLIFNTILPLLTTYFVYKVFVHYQKNKITALLYAVTILFGSVLFNYANPHVVHYLSPPIPLRMIIPGWETYPSIIRVPNPQFSYFILSICVFLFVQCRNKFYLFLPIPVLYYSVLIPYVFLLAVSFLARLCKNKLSVFKLVFLNIFVYVLLAGCIYLIFNDLGDLGKLIKSCAGPNCYLIGRNFYFPLVGCVGCLLYVFFKLSGIFRQNGVYEKVFLTLIFACFAITNFQLIDGFALALKNYQDYGNSIVGGLILILSFELLTDAALEKGQAGKQILSYIRIFFQCFILMFIAKYTLLSQNFSFNKYNFLVESGNYLTQAEVERIKTDSLHVILVGADFSQKLPYGFAKMLAPVFAYQYNYPFISKQCSYNELLSNNALSYVDQHYAQSDPISKQIHARAQEFFKTTKEIPSLAYQDSKYSYCKLMNYQSAKFYLIVPRQLTEKRFPDWRKLYFKLFGWL